MEFQAPNPLKNQRIEAYLVLARKRGMAMNLAPLLILVQRSKHRIAHCSVAVILAGYSIVAVILMGHLMVTVILMGHLIVAVVSRSATHQAAAA